VTDVAAPPPRDEPPPLDALLRWTTRVSRAGLVLLGGAWLADSIVVWLDLSSRIVGMDAARLHTDWLDVAAAGAVLAMGGGAVRAGAVERQRDMLRERQRAAADQARRNAYHERAAARAAAEQASAHSAILFAAARDASIDGVTAAPEPAAPLTTEHSRDGIVGTA
jgi:hypothetical protein